mgnify:CR=1 FL=1
MTNQDLTVHQSQAISLPTEQIEGLKQPTAAPFKYARKGKGGMTFTYVDIGYVTGMLNKIFGHMWTFEIKDKGIEKEYGQVWVQGELKVLCSDGKVITKQQFGSSDIKMDKGGKAMSVGDDLKSAASDAMKKCASMLGLAADVYHPKTWNLVEQMKVKAEQNDKELSQELDSIAQND